MPTGARARKQKYISLYMKTFLKTGVLHIYNFMILFTSPKEFQDVGPYKIILSQKTFVSVSQTPFAISTPVFRGSESSIILSRI